MTREPGVCALTAGPGVTNGMSAIASAHKNNSPMVVLGGRAPQMRWGQGSLQEIDHVPFVAPAHQERAHRDRRPPRSPSWSTRRSRPRSRRRPGPTFVDLPLDVVFMEADDPASPRRCPTRPRCRPPTAKRSSGSARCSAAAERPVIMAGTDLYWGHGERALRELSEALGIPVFLNGLARGCLPADHPNFFSRARSAGLKGADVALVIGVPMDFRLGFGGSFGEDTQIVAGRRRRARAASAPRELAAELYGGLPATLSALREAALERRRRRRSAPPAGATTLRATEDEKRAAERDRARTTTARRCTRCASTRS